MSFSVSVCLPACLPPSLSVCLSDISLLFPFSFSFFFPRLSFFIVSFLFCKYDYVHCCFPTDDTKLPTKTNTCSSPLTEEHSNFCYFFISPQCEPPDPDVKSMSTGAVNESYVTHKLKIVL